MSSNSTSIPPERPKNPTHYGGEGLYDAAGADEATPLKVQLGEHLDTRTRRSLHGQLRSRSSFEFVKGNLIPVALAVGGLAFLLAALARKSMRD